MKIKKLLTYRFQVAGHATRSTQPPNQIASDKEVSVLPATVVGAETCDDWCSTNSCDQFIAALVDIVLLQIVRE